MVASDLDDDMCELDDIMGPAMQGIFSDNTARITSANVADLGGREERNRMFINKVEQSENRKSNSDAASIGTKGAPMETAECFKPPRPVTNIQVRVNKARKPPKRPSKMQMKKESKSATSNKVFAHS